MFEYRQVRVGSVVAPLASGEDALAQYFFTGSEIDNQERDTRACRKGAKHIPLPALEEGRVDDNPLTGFDHDACQIEQLRISCCGHIGAVQAFRNSGPPAVQNRQTVHALSFDI